MKEVGVPIVHNNHIQYRKATSDIVQWCFIAEYIRLPDIVKLATNMNMSKTRLDEHWAQWRGRRGQATPEKSGGSWTTARGLKTTIASIICRSIGGPLDYITINKDH